MPLVIYVIVRSNRSKVENFLVDFDFGVDTYIAMFVAPREIATEIAIIVHISRDLF